MEMDGGDLAVYQPGSQSVEKQHSRKGDDEKTKMEKGKGKGKDGKGIHKAVC